MFAVQQLINWPIVLRLKDADTLWVAARCSQRVIRGELQAAERFYVKPSNLGMINRMENHEQASVARHSAIGDDHLVDDLGGERDTPGDGAPITALNQHPGRCAIRRDKIDQEPKRKLLCRPIHASSARISLGRPLPISPIDLFWVFMSPWWPAWRDALKVILPKPSCAGAVILSL
jgi:hypothetical protein